jgi:hypothetical protein
MSEDPKGFDAGDYNLFRYCHNDPLDLTDPMGLDPEFWLIRDYAGLANSSEARRAAADLYVKDNGRYEHLGRTNENGFRGNSQGVRQGDYKLIPKGDSWGAGKYPADQPAITGNQAGLKPGQPNSSYKAPALVHKAGQPGQADSLACVTCSPETEARVKQIMRDNDNKVPFHIREPAKAKPVNSRDNQKSRSESRNPGERKDAASQEPGRNAETEKGDSSPRLASDYQISIGRQF